MKWVQAVKSLVYDPCNILLGVANNVESYEVELLLNSDWVIISRITAECPSQEFEYIL